MIKYAIRKVGTEEYICGHSYWSQKWAPFTSAALWHRAGNTKAIITNLKRASRRGKFQDDLMEVVTVDCTPGSVVE